MLQRMLFGPNSGFLVIAAIAFYLAISSLSADVFLDESESAPLSDEERQLHGLKATKVTRPLVFGGFLMMAIFCLWKASRP